MNKLYPNTQTALAGIVQSGQIIAVGSFDLCGIPRVLIDALLNNDALNLTCISNNVGVDGFGIGQLRAIRLGSRSGAGGLYA